MPWDGKKNRIWCLRQMLDIGEGRYLTEPPGLRINAPDFAGKATCGALLCRRYSSIAADKGNMAWRQ